MDPQERVPVPLTLDDFNEESLMYAIEMKVPVQVTVLDTFEAMVHDEILWNAHRRGLVPIGQPFITTRPLDAEHKPVEQGPLTEGVEMKPMTFSGPEQAMRDRVRRNNEETMAVLFGGVPQAPQQVIVRAEILIGTAL